MEFTEFWALEREHGHGLTIQPLIPVSKLGLQTKANPNRVLGSLLGNEHLEFDAKKNDTDGMTGAACTKSGVHRHKVVMRYQ